MIERTANKPSGSCHEDTMVTRRYHPRPVGAVPAYRSGLRRIYAADVATSRGPATVANTRCQRLREEPCIENKPCDAAVPAGHSMYCSPAAQADNSHTPVHAIAAATNTRASNANAASHSIKAVSIVSQPAIVGRIMPRRSDHGTPARRSAACDAIGRFSPLRRSLTAVATRRMPVIVLPVTGMRHRGACNQRFNHITGTIGGG